MYGKGIEWWYVDVGYITEQITRYPEPKIHNYDKLILEYVKVIFIVLDFMYLHLTDGIF